MKQLLVLMLVASLAAMVAGCPLVSDTRDAGAADAR